MVPCWGRAGFGKISLFLDMRVVAEDSSDGFVGDRVEVGVGVRVVGILVGELDIATSRGELDWGGLVESFRP